MNTEHSSYFPAKNVKKGPLTWSEINCTVGYCLVYVVRVAARKNESIEKSRNPCMRRDRDVSTPFTCWFPEQVVSLTPCLQRSQTRLVHDSTVRTCP